tara:strand:- start:2032 stop:3099 length:1068 start_codon:yes stop_codon:yes gene_type:complete
MTKLEKKCVGIIFGGNSNEHEISISSAKTVFKAFSSKLNKTRFKVKVFYINKKGNWFDSDESIKIILDENLKDATNTSDDFNLNKLNFLDNIEFRSIDVWFPLLHGLNGEDGAIHGLLKFTQKPLVGCGILGSALGMDKIMMKKIFSLLDIPQINYLAIQNQNLNENNVKLKVTDQIIEKLKFPLFVKPSNSGSSLGISKVKEKSELFQALEKAFSVDKRIVVEEGLEVRELECGIIGKSKLFTSEIGEVSYSTDWYDYDSKYSKNNKLIIPANINYDISQRIKDIAIKSCRALNIYGFARVDFFLTKNTNKIFLNEINTIPGFTSKSMFPMLWESSGLNLDQLVARLVDISLDL